jgi:hypothetical protein
MNPPIKPKPIKPPTIGEASLANDHVYEAVASKIARRMPVFTTDPWIVIVPAAPAYPARWYTATFAVGLAVAITRSP